MILFAIAIFIVLVALDFSSLRKEKDKKELTVYWVLSAVTLVYLIVLVSGREVFSPSEKYLEFISKIGLNYANWHGNG